MQMDLNQLLDHNAVVSKYQVYLGRNQFYKFIVFQNLFS